MDGIFITFLFSAEFLECEIFYLIKGCDILSYVTDDMLYIVTKCYTGNGFSTIMQFSGITEIFFFFPYC